MSKNSDDKIVKYTIMPRNEQDEYFENFKLSLTEFAKALDGKVLIAPFIVYNSDLDIPMDMDEQIEEYCMYASKEELLDVIRKKETMDVFRTLILHGFDISLDETRDIYCALSRRNEADVCVNVIEDLNFEGFNFKENLTFATLLKFVLTGPGQRILIFTLDFSLFNSSRIPSDNLTT